MNPLKWLTLPPIVAIGTVAVTRTMASVLTSESVNPAVWMLTVLLFVILTALYGMFITYGFNAGLLPLQLLAQTTGPSKSSRGQSSSVMSSKSVSPWPTQERC